MKNLVYHVLGLPASTNLKPQQESLCLVSSARYFILKMPWLWCMSWEVFSSSKWHPSVSMSWKDCSFLNVFQDRFMRPLPLPRNKTDVHSGSEKLHLIHLCAERIAPFSQLHRINTMTLRLLPRNRMYTYFGFEKSIFMWSMWISKVSQRVIYVLAFCSFSNQHRSNSMNLCPLPKHVVWD